jgi:hypothetical protein
MPDCGCNDNLGFEGIIDESHLQFALQTIGNYSISLWVVQSVNGPAISRQFCAFSPHGGTFGCANASYISGSLRQCRLPRTGRGAFAANLSKFRRKVLTRLTKSGKSFTVRKSLGYKRDLLVLTSWFRWQSVSPFDLRGIHWRGGLIG